MEFQVWAIGLGCDFLLATFKYRDCAEAFLPVAERINDGWKYMIVETAQEA